MPIVRANGIDVAYEERGGGEPLLLIAGIGMQLVAWPEGLLRELVARGFRVVTFDHRDVGLSTKLEHAGVPRLKSLLARALVGLPVGAPYTLFDMADDTAGVLDALGVERAHVVGTSMGGMVAQALAAAHPRRVSSLVSMMSQSGGRLLTVGRPRATMKLLRPAPRSRDEAIARMLDFFATARSTRFMRDDAALAERAARAYDRCFYPRGFARHFAAVLATGDMRPRLRAVRAPTLVLHGGDDPVIRAARGRATARAIPGARFRLIEGWGHDLPEGAHALLAGAIADHARAAGASLSPERFRRP